VRGSIPLSSTKPPPPVKVGPGSTSIRRFRLIVSGRMPGETGAILEGRPSMTMLRGAALGLMLLAACRAGSAGRCGERCGERVQKLTRATPWKQVDAIPIGFRTFHPQGMVKIGEVFYVSSVDIQVPTKRFPEPQGGYDRDTGAGVGHLFKVDAKGNLLGDLTLGEGSIYHPRGIDYRGKGIWVPVSDDQLHSPAS